MQRVWIETYTKDIDFFVSYKRGVNHNESTDDIDVPVKFWALLKHKSSAPISSTPREKQFITRRKIIFNLQQDYKEP